MANEKESKVNRMERESRNARGKPLHGNYAGMSVDPDTGKYIDKPTSIQREVFKNESRADEMERESRNARGKPLHGNYAGMSVDPKTGEYVRKVVNVGKGGGGSGGASSDRRELQLGSDLDPKSMMKREDMKKGGAVKKYGKGGDVQSESSKLDQKNANMDKAQEEGYKRYQKQEADEARENAESRNIGKRLKDTALKAVDTVVTPIANKVHDANEYLSKKSEGVLSQKQREAMFGNPSKDREDWKKSSEKMTKDSYKKGGKVSSASSRGDGIATKGKTRGRIV